MFESAALNFVSEDALLIEYGEKLDDAIYQQVLALDFAISQSELAKHIESQPTFRSLLLKFDPFRISHDALLDALARLEPAEISLASTAWRVPVCFSGQYAQDLAEAAHELGLEASQVIDILLDSPLKLYMYGFAPGLAYLGGLDARLKLPRRATPRSDMPVGSLMIAGGLACLTSVSLPTGWYVLGQTPIKMFSLNRDPMVPFSVGDELNLYPVDSDEFNDLQASGDLAGISAI